MFTLHTLVSYCLLISVTIHTSHSRVLLPSYFCHCSHFTLSCSSVVFCCCWVFFFFSFPVHASLHSPCSTAFSSLFKSTIRKAVNTRYSCQPIKLSSDLQQSTGHPTGRIIGGTRVVDRCVAPFNAMVALQLLPTNPSLKVTYCSGVMLSADLIVTAALLCLSVSIGGDWPLI